jgi:hypothetical protein
MVDREDRLDPSAVVILLVLPKPALLTKTCSGLRSQKLGRGGSNLLLRPEIGTQQMNVLVARLAPNLGHRFIGTELVPGRSGTILLPFRPIPAR